MIIKFHVDIPFWQRLKILWYGRVFVMANYKGQNKKLHVELGAINPNDMIQGDENDNH